MNRYLSPVYMNIQGIQQKIFLFLLIIVIGSNTGLSQCIQDTNNIYTFKVDENTYQLIKENKSWADAQSCAVSLGGHLAIIGSQTEQDSIFANINRASINTNSTLAPDGGGAAYIWLAGNDTLIEGDWVWDNPGDTNTQFWQGDKNGSSIGGLFNNWGNEPDNFQNQDALGLALTSWPLGVAGEWNDVDEGNTLYYLVEFTVLSSINKNSVKKNAFKVFPNPALSEVSLAIDLKYGKAVNYQIVDTKGSIVLEGSYSGSPIKVEQLVKGTYWIKLNGSKEAAIFQKR